MLVQGESLKAYIFGIASAEAGAAGGLSLNRVPAWARAQYKDPLFSYAQACPAGGSLRFTTSATSVTLLVSAMAAAAPGEEVQAPILVVRQSTLEQGTLETALPVENPSALVVSADGSVNVVPAAPQRVQIPVNGPQAVEVLFPHNAMLEIISIEADQEVVPAPPTGLRWTHHGSSISHGMNAATAALTWPQQAASSLGWTLNNLAFAGNAQLDPFMAKMIRDTPADVISLKIGINLVNSDSMRERTFLPALHGFIDTIREVQKETPIILISAIACPIHEKSPGPVYTGPDGKMRATPRSIKYDAGALTLEGTRRLMQEVYEQRVASDANLHFICGLELFGFDDAGLLYDDLHPDQEGLDLIAQRFIQQAPQLLQ